MSVQIDQFGSSVSVAFGVPVASGFWLHAQPTKRSHSTADERRGISKWETTRKNVWNPGSGTGL